MSVFFNLFSKVEPFAAILIAHGTHRAPPHQLGGWGSTVSSASGVRAEPQLQIHFGPTKCLENVSTGCKCRTQFNFFTEHWRSCGTLRYHWFPWVRL